MYVYVCMSVTIFTSEKIKFCVKIKLHVCNRVIVCGNYTYTYTYIHTYVHIYIFTCIHGVQASLQVIITIAPELRTIGSGGDGSRTALEP